MGQDARAARLNPREQALYDAVQALALEGCSVVRINAIVFEAFEQATPGEVG